MRKNEHKPAIHMTLLIISVVFMFPFFWMVSTSVKPREQTMVHPPVWIPKQFTAVLNGRETVVIKDHLVAEPCAIVRCVEAPVEGKRMLVAADGISDGRVGMQTREGFRRIRVEILKEVPASEGRLWCYVVEFIPGLTREHAPEWDCVPLDEVKASPHLMLSNYREAVNLNQAVPDPLPPDAGFKDKLRRLLSVPMLRCLGNTLIVCFFSVVGVVASSACAAYGFSRIRWNGRDTLFFILLCTMMIPFPVTMVPLFIIFRKLGMVGTLLPLFIPAWFGNVFFIFLLRQFFFTIPGELSDAARIDGCSEFGIFMRIILPLSRPALAVVALFEFLWCWNDFLGPLIYLNDERAFTLALGLQNFESQHGGTEWHLLMAGATIVILPVIVLFFFTQKTFIQGIATTGLKA
ncbi:MAG TPA: carbohydrate ABC transporter permease [Candidatus Brocadiia bacterium]|nr:carbohydrate ABC transporter permease [Candidatus Brocadiia bacterium]